jgi:hypothetical protein
MVMNNVPDDWYDWYTVCPDCGKQYHMSDGECSFCALKDQKIKDEWSQEDEEIYDEWDSEEDYKYQK